MSEERNWRVVATDAATGDRHVVHTHLMQWRATFIAAQMNRDHASDGVVHSAEQLPEFLGECVPGLGRRA